MATVTPHSAEAVNACHDLLLWIIPQLDKLPRVRRFTLGERIENGLLATWSRPVRGPGGSAGGCP